MHLKASRGSCTFGAFSSKVSANKTPNGLQQIRRWKKFNMPLSRRGKGGIIWFESWTSSLSSREYLRIQEVCPTGLHVLCGLRVLWYWTSPFLLVLFIFSWTDFLNAVKGQRAQEQCEGSDCTGAVAMRCYTTGMVSRHKCACQNSFHGKNQ